MPAPLHIDCVILGGGAAGLWTLDAVRRSGRSVLLLESGELGAGQTVCAQGIIHGGLKYTLRGLFTPAAEAISTMPGVWRSCLAGEREPSLRGTRIRAHHCFLWRTQSVSSTLGMLGAMVGLRVKPSAVEPEERPAALRECPGSVARLDEQVIDPVSMLHELSTRHRDVVLKVDLRHGLEIRDGAERLIVSVIEPRSGDLLDLAPGTIVLAAGRGNDSLRRICGLPNEVAQMRPLHMAMVRFAAATSPGAINGHCVDGARTRVTVTSSEDTAARVVWQLGGQIAEDGVALDGPALIARAAEELRAVMPGTTMERALPAAEWATYRVDRAERRTAGAGRPDDAQLLRDGRILTAWPTKLALAPRLAELVIAALPPAGAAFDEERVAAWTRPLVALPPWEQATQWSRA